MACLTIATGTATLAAGSVGSCAAGDYVTVAVGDDGTGMSADVIERVFEPFFTTKPVGKGTGLGLSQLFALVRQMNGEVAIRSQPGEGTTVTLYLPRHAAGSDAPSAEHAVETAADAASDTLVVLVVEDDPRVLAATVGALDELGHHAIACNDPLAAPAMVDSQAIDLVMSDVLMPGQTGPELIASLTLHHPHLAVLFVTGYAGEAGGATEFGGHHVLRKPFTLTALERAIGDAVAANRPAAPDRLAAE